MPRPLVYYVTLFVLTLILASCDVFGGSVPEVVGTWRGDSATVAILVSSRVPQMLPDFSQPAEDGLRVTGAETATLRYVGCRTRANPQTLVIAEGPIVSFCRPEGRALSASGLGTMRWTFYLGGGQVEYRGETANPDALQFTPEGYTLQPITLRNADTGAEVSLGGAVRFPQIKVSARRPTPVPNSSRTLDVAETEVEFGADGAFRITSRTVSGGTFQIVGTWRHIDGARLEVDFGQFVPIGGTPTSEPTARVATAEIRDGHLAFFLADSARPDDRPETLAAIEAEFHAETGTFTSAIEGTLYDLGRVAE